MEIKSQIYAAQTLNNGKDKSKCERTVSQKCVCSGRYFNVSFNNRERLSNEINLRMLDSSNLSNFDNCIAFGLHEFIVHLQGLREAYLN